MMLKAIIIEDEMHNRETLRNLLIEFCKGVQVIGMAGNVEEGIALIQNTQPDLLFLDIELQTGTGFDILAQVESINFEVVFTTAFEQYALKAIKFSSLDYLLKPIDLEELQMAVNKAQQKKSQNAQQAQLDILMSHLAQTANPSPRKICLATANGLEFVTTSDILYCEAAGSYTHFHLSNQKIMVSKNLKEYELLLDEYAFMRVHNRYLINLHEVRRFVKSEGGYILMNNGDQISISPKKRPEFLERMSALG